MKKIDAFTMGDGVPDRDLLLTEYPPKEFFKEYLRRHFIIILIGAANFLIFGLIYALASVSPHYGAILVIAALFFLFVKFSSEIQTLILTIRHLFQNFNLK